MITSLEYDRMDEYVEQFFHEEREALAEGFDPDKDARKDQIARIRQRLQMAQAEAAAEAMRGGPGRDM